MNLEEIRTRCENDLFFFARVMFPNHYYGDVHRQLFEFFQAEDNEYQLALIPRDHLKSHCIAVYCAWKLTVKPWWTFLYVSANPGLVKDQLGVIENIFLSDQHRELWPEMLNFQKDRSGTIKHRPTSVWNSEAIVVDHPLRKERQVRDPSVRTTSVKSSKTGYHCNEVIFDDLVTDENYDSDAARLEVLRCYANCMKIATTGSLVKGVGTRYGDNDLYALVTELMLPVLNEEGEEIGEEPMWSVFERVVEDSPRRTGDGNFLWPRMQMPNGEWYGFDRRELMKKKLNITLEGDESSFYAQYYNDPNMASTHRITRDSFQYLEPKLLHKDGYSWTYAGKKLKLLAAMDVAFSAKGAKRRDYTVIAVVGMDKDGYLYVLDMDRFQTDRMEEYYDRMVNLLTTWEFRDLWIESANGGVLVASYIEDRLRREGGLVKVNSEAPPNDKSKAERIMQILEPRYRNKEVFHNKIGLARILEEELMLARPKNDDCKDVLAFAVSKLKPPLGQSIVRTMKDKMEKISRFGGGRGPRTRRG